MQCYHVGGNYEASFTEECSVGEDMFNGKVSLSAANVDIIEWTVKANPFLRGYSGSWDEFTWPLPLSLLPF